MSFSDAPRTLDLEPANMVGVRMCTHACLRLGVRVFLCVFALLLHARHRFCRSVRLGMVCARVELCDYIISG